MTYHPLHGPDEEPPSPASLAGELEFARRDLDQLANANIHDHDEMIRAATVLNYHLRALIAALDAERGERT